MKRDIENNTLIFEKVTCWDCNGEKKVTRNNLCPLYHKPVTKYPGRVCPHCGAKNRNDHKVVGQKVVDCSTCDKTGEIMEDKFTNLPESIYETFEFKVMCENGGQTFNEKFLGIGLVGGATDYGRMAEVLQKEGEQEVVKQVVEDYNFGRQALNFLDKNNKLPNYLMIKVNRNGYSVYPIFNFEAVDYVIGFLINKSWHDKIEISAAISNALGEKTINNFS